jgi:hypothetical protein
MQPRVKRTVVLVAAIALTVTTLGLAHASGDHDTPAPRCRPMPQQDCPGAAYVSDDATQLVVPD